MFDKKLKGKYIEITKKHYKNMKFDDKGNFIDQNIPELNQLIIGIDYIEMADSFFNSTGEFYIIKGRYIPKEKIQGILYEQLSKCKNKKPVRNTCIRMLRELSSSVERDGGDDIGKR